MEGIKIMSIFQGGGQISPNPNYVGSQKEHLDFTEENQKVSILHNSYVLL